MCGHARSGFRPLTPERPCWGQVLGGAALSTCAEPELRARAARLAEDGPGRCGAAPGRRAARSQRQRETATPGATGKAPSTPDPPARGSSALRAPGGPAPRRRLPACTASCEAGARTPRSGTILWARSRRPAPAGRGRRQRAPSSAPAANRVAPRAWPAPRSRRGAPATRPQGWGAARGGNAGAALSPPARPPEASGSPRGPGPRKPRRRMPGARLGTQRHARAPPAPGPACSSRERCRPQRRPRGQHGAPPPTASGRRVTSIRSERFLALLPAAPGSRRRGGLGPGPGGRARATPEGTGESLAAGRGPGDRRPPHPAPPHPPPALAPGRQPS